MTEPSAAPGKTSALCDAHRDAGATFAEYRGWVMPSHYTDDRDEQSAVRSSAGLIDLSYHGAIRVTGAEGTQFLNGLVTNDVKTLERGKVLAAAFLTGHGKVRALCRIARFEDGYLILNDPQTHDKVFTYVFPFSYAGDFQVADVSDQYRILSIQGPSAYGVMKEVCFEPVPELGEAESLPTTIAGHHCIVTGSQRTGEIGFDLLVDQNALKDVWEFVLLKGAFHGIRPVGHDALEALRIEAGKLVYGSDVDETNMMLETGLKDSVSFTKGCYTGQEAVAMATYRGHVSKQMTGLKLEGQALPNHGAKILADQKEIGYVTSSLDSITIGSVIALGYVKFGYADPGKIVQVETPTGAVNAILVELPFYRRRESNPVL